MIRLPKNCELGMHFSKNKLISKILCWLAAVSASGMAIAQQTPTVAGQAVEELVVEATRLSRPLDRVPAAVSVVGQNEIQLGRQQLALDEALTRVPGLFMQNRYNFAQDLRISIRGFGARSPFGIRGIKILVDGIPETLPDGTGQVDNIDLGATRQIEVIRGASSSLYGNASGGVISITSENGPETPFISTRLTVGEFDYQKLQVKAGGQTDRVNYLVSLSDSDIEGYRSHSQAENRQFSGRFNFDLGNDSNFLASVNITDQPTSDDPGGINAAQAAADRRSARDRNVAYDSGEVINQKRVGFVYSTPVGSSGEFSARSYIVSRDFFTKLPLFPVGQAVDVQRSFAGGGISYSHSGMLGNLPNRLIVGFDTDDQDDDRQRFVNDLGVIGARIFDQNESFTARGLFIQNELTVNENLQVSFGLRYDDVDYAVEDRFLSNGDDSGSRSMDEVSPMLGVVFGLSPETSVYGTMSTAFEAPSTTDFANPSGGGGFNQALGPQTATNYEVGLRTTLSDRHYFEAALFNVQVDDELVPFEIDGRDFFQNAGESSRSGIELALVSNLTDRVRTSLTYSYGNFEFDDFRQIAIDAGGASTVTSNFSGNTIPGTVEHLMFGEISYTDPSGWFAALDVMYVGEQFANNSNSVKAGSYTLANMRMGFERALGSTVISPFFGINNLLDEKYNDNLRLNAFGSRYFEPAPEINVYAGVSVHFDFE
jgi:iron complex outermembrane recepter protein